MNIPIFDTEVFNSTALAAPSSIMLKYGAIPFSCRFLPTPARPGFTFRQCSSFRQSGKNIWCRCRKLPAPLPEGRRARAVKATSGRRPPAGGKKTISAPVRRGRDRNKRQRTAARDGAPERPPHWWRPPGPDRWLHLKHHPPRILSAVDDRRCRISGYMMASLATEARKVSMRKWSGWRRHPSVSATLGTAQRAVGSHSSFTKTQKVNQPSASVSTTFTRVFVRL